MENLEIARVLGEVADLLEIQGANPFRVRAYRNAKRTVDGLSARLDRQVEAGADLTELPGIGKEMARHIAELVETGSLGVHEEMLSQLSHGLLDLIRLPNVGPKKAKKLWEELGVETIDDLETAAREQRVRELAGFGAKSEAKILDGIAEHRQHRGRFKLVEVDAYAEPLLEHLRQTPGLARLEVAGSYRRRKETVGDLDLLAIIDTGGGEDEATAAARRVIERFTGYPRVGKVLMAGDTRASVTLASGLQVDLRVLPPESYGAALVYFTGSKEHCIRLRRRGVERGLRISEYGVFREDPEEAENDQAGGDSGDRGPLAGERIAGADEQEVYAAVDLPWIPPELREDRGEIEAAAAGELPELIALGDVRGDLHMHSTWSDGRSTIEEMLAACAERGYEYLAISDHSQALAMTGGLDEKRLAEQWDEIDEVAARHSEIRLLKSMEVDILAEGELDLADEMLERLDLVIVSVHSRFELSESRQTERVLRALEHPQVDLLAHPTGRLLNRRKAFDLDLEAVLERAAELGVAVELNAQPHRLDLKDDHLMLARRLGVKVVIDTDAHHTRHLELMRYGVEQARRAWLGPGDVLNTLPLDELLGALRGGSMR